MGFAQDLEAIRTLRERLRMLETESDTRRVFVAARNADAALAPAETWLRDRALATAATRTVDAARIERTRAPRRETRKRA